jgi:cytochrome c553
MQLRPHRICRFLPRAARSLLVLAGAALAGAAMAADPAMARRMQACTPCHGATGVAAPDGYHPRIAGKPAGYLQAQLQHFRDGRRQNATMAHLVEHMDDAYLRDIAAYFAALALPYPSPLTAAAVRMAVPGADLARGEQLALRGDAGRSLPACAACHGAALTGVQPALPGLLGLPPAYVMGQVGAWRSGLRRAVAPDCMHDVARRLNDADLAAVAAWLALQPLPADTRPAAALPAPLPQACGSAGP